MRSTFRLIVILGICALTIRTVALTAGNPILAHPHAESCGINTAASIEWYEQHWHPERRLHPTIAACFLPGTPPEVMEYVHSQLETTAAQRFVNVGRWPGIQGDPILLTWSFMPDGVIIPTGIGEPAASSELFARMDVLYAGQGGRAAWIARFQQCFNRWAALMGTSYIRFNVPGQDWDDGAEWGNESNGSTRGDIRIGMKFIDGAGNLAAYNFYPVNGGDMVMDRDEDWANVDNNNLFLRNIVTHEHGHGLGMAHVCPVIGGTSGRLMEPFLNTLIDGPQHDDIRGSQRHYGDNDEPNNSSATATNLGTVALGVPVNRGNMPAPVVADTSILSIDGDGKQDFFKFTAPFSAKLSTITVTPRGYTYDSSTQNLDATCNAGNFINSMAMRNLNFQIIGSDGATVIATADAQPAGAAESLTNVSLTGSPGVFYIRIYDATAVNQSQLYSLDFTVVTDGVDLSPPTPNPLTWASSPAPASTSAVTMTATTAFDADTPPVQYEFDFTTGLGSGAADSGWQSSPIYVNTGMSANGFFSYRARARDSATVPNMTGYSSTLTGSTLIETPVSVGFGTITGTSIAVVAGGGFTNVGFINTGFFFEMSPAHGTGGNAWIGTSSTTVTGLTPGTLYTFRVKARNWNSIETPFCAPSAAVTPGGTCTLEGDVNLDSKRDGRDVAGFTRCKLAAPLPADYCPCADMGNGNDDLDIAEFVNSLLGI